MDSTKLTIGALAIGVLILLGFIFTSSGTSVSAVGESVLKATPDKVSVYINAEARNKTAADAKAEHDRIVDELTLKLLRAGVKSDEIKTQSYNIYPEYDWSDGTQKEKGYVVSQQFIIETADFDSVVEIVDAAVNAGTYVSYINFELSEEKQDEYKTRVLEEAGKDAKKKAEAIAAGVDKKVGRLVSVESQDFYYPGPIIYYDKVAVAGAEGSGIAEARSAALNLAPSDIEVRATIKVEYKLRSF